MRWLAALVAALSAHSALNARLLRTPVAGPVRSRVSVLLPLRDEAGRVGPCLSALQAQTLDVELLVLDDGSTDGTAALVEAATGRPPLTGAPLPPGWLGKPWACRQLADAASGDVLVFVDADVVLTPDAVAATVALLEQTGMDLVSPYPRQEAPAATRLVQPLLQWSWLTFLPLRLAERPGNPSLAAANGQLLAVRRSAYDRAGGHGAVRAEVVEDVALLRALKRAGGRGGVVDGTALATTRMYDGWDELVEGYAKSLHTVPVAALALLAALYVVPPLAALRGSRAGAFATAAAVAGRVVTARRTGGRPLDAVTHPLGVAVLLALAVRSRVRHRRGALTWKGRALPGS